MPTIVWIVLVVPVVAVFAYVFLFRKKGVPPEIEREALPRPAPSKEAKPSPAAKGPPTIEPTPGKPVPEALPSSDVVVEPSVPRQPVAPTSAGKRALSKKDV